MDLRSQLCLLYSQRLNEFLHLANPVEEHVVVLLVEVVDHDALSIEYLPVDALHFCYLQLNSLLKLTRCLLEKPFHLVKDSLSLILFK